MQRKSRTVAAVQRTQARPAKRRERPREAAQQPERTGGQRREEGTGEAHARAGPEPSTQPRITRRPQPQAHPDVLTVAIRGTLAAKMRALARSSGMSLARLLSDALLVYESHMETGYEPGTSLQAWQERTSQPEQPA